MKRTRRRFDRDFKISVIAELEAGKPLAQVAREHGIHPSLSMMLFQMALRCQYLTPARHLK